jgi:hypothetical protein
VYECTNERVRSEVARICVDWYRELIERVPGSRRPSPLSLAAGGVQLAGRAGPLRGLRAAEPYAGRRPVASE